MGFGETQLNSIKFFFNNKDNMNILNELEKILVIKDTKIQDAKGLLKDKTFMLTGKAKWYQ
jgi:NAD-dependent DNA ligase